MVTFGLQLFVFVHDFPLERAFSLLRPRDRFSFFFLSVVLHQCQLPGLQKSGTARSNWSREVNSDTAPVVTDNGPDFRMPTRDFLIKMYSLGH